MKTFAIAATALLGSAFVISAEPLTVRVTNPTDMPRLTETVELPSSEIMHRLGSRHCYITTSDGKELPSQITHDGKLIFQISTKPHETVQLCVNPSDTAHTYPTKVSGQVYPERADDMAWENDLVGFRAYGPKTQAKGEKAYGYDIFFKHPTDEQILEKLYAPETSPATWAKVDSLRHISNELAEDYIKTFSYHIDHGLGMDCYAVGPTLGAGVAVPVVNDSLSYSWCYDKATVLDNGPIRFTVRLDFAPRTIGKDEGVVEHRLISLDACSHLNSTKVWYDGLTEPRTMAVGFPLRDESETVAEDKIIAYADPTQGPDNGKAYLGVVAEKPFAKNVRMENHVLGLSDIDASGAFSYKWGFAWSKEPVNAQTPDMKVWSDYLRRVEAQVKDKLIISY